MKDYINEIKRTLDALKVADIEKVVDLLLDTYKTGKQVFILGNGGSAATASHMACDLGKGTLVRVRDQNEKRFRVISLTDNVPLLTAYANDLSFDDVFVQQLRNLIKKGDLVIALSASGDSVNVINAIRYAKKVGAKTIGLLGFFKGGKLANLVDCAVIVQSKHYGPIEDVHLIISHILTSLIAETKMKHDGA